MSPTSRSACSARTASSAAASASRPGGTLGRATAAPVRSPCPSSATAAINKGTFHEALNFAAVQRLPVVFVCENNQYAQYTAIARTTSVDDLAVEPTATGSRAIPVDGNDARALSHEAAEAAVERARAGEGPTLLHLDTYRYGGHYVGDAEEYRTKEEVEGWRERDPIERLEAASRRGRVLDEPGRAERLEAAVAPKSTRRSASRRRARTRIRPTRSTACSRTRDAMSSMSFGQATVDAMQLAMRDDDRVIVLGEDIGWGGSFGQFRGLLDEFGPERVIDMPISEAHHRRPRRRGGDDGPAPGRLDELRRVHDGRDGRDRQPGGEVPLHVRRPGERADGAARLRRHASLVGGPALREPRGAVRARPGPQGRGAVDAGGREGAARGGDRRRRPGRSTSRTSRSARVAARRSRRAPHEVPLGQASVRRPGTDVTLVAYSIMARHAEQAAQELAEDGIDVELIDLRTLVPLDLETVARLGRQDAPGGRLPRGVDGRRLRRRGRGADHRGALRRARGPGRAGRRADVAHPVQPAARAGRRAAEARRSSAPSGPSSRGRAADR